MIEQLDWDSAFLGYKVGRTTVEADIPEMGDYDLIYLFIDPRHEAANADARSRGAILADEKITYVKTGRTDLLPDAGIRSYTSFAETDEDVIRIGIQSGVYSRFSVDRNFPPEVYMGLYRLWMERSIRRDIASDVLIAEDHAGTIAGVLTLGTKNGRTDIGILAVDQKSRGQRFGQRLIAQAERETSRNGFSAVQVVTQRVNQPACRFYEQNGFHIDRVENVYHLWKG